MKYIYTAEKCPACIKLKAEFDRDGVEYTERSGSRLKSPADDWDEIDVDAFAELSANNMTLPIVVER